eukprot:scaffold59504_cov20-Prasinocladus_malaysianus.AAC.1
MVKRENAAGRNVWVSLRRSGMRPGTNEPFQRSACSAISRGRCSTENSTRFAFRLLYAMT